MPSISRFHGISIYIYAERDSPHHLPHFHAYYGKSMASFSINPLNLLNGSLPHRQLRLVYIWAEVNKEKLMENWQRVQNGQFPIQINGL